MNNTGVKRDGGQENKKASILDLQLAAHATLLCVDMKIAKSEPQTGDFPGGPVVRTPRFHCSGVQVGSLVRELDPACHN